MKVCILTDDGEIIWWRAKEPMPAGFIATSYLHNGTQQKIIAALVEALEQARGQLGGLSLQVIDVGGGRANIRYVTFQSPSCGTGMRAGSSL